MKKYVISLFLILGLCVNTFAQVHRPQGNHKPSVSRNTYGNIVKSEVVSQPDQKNLNVLKFARNKIYDYYGRTSFDEPEWERVKKFLIFLDENGTRLNALFNKRYKKYFYTLPKEKKEQLIGAFWGANYLTNTFIDKDFDLGIAVSKVSQSTLLAGTISINAGNVVEAIDLAIHEATHSLNFIGTNGYNTQGIGLLSEKLTIFAQLYLGLPIPITKNKIRIGTRTWYLHDQDKFIEENYEEILGEYSAMFFAAAEYDQYIEEIANFSTWTDLFKQSLGEVITGLAYIDIINTWGYEKYGKKYTPVKASNFLDQQIVNNAIFQNVSDIIVKNFLDDYNNLTDYTKEEISTTFNEWFEENNLEVATIIFQELAKSASKNIPPVPEGYI